jgi:hypothetical protein
MIDINFLGRKTKNEISSHFQKTNLFITGNMPRLENLGLALISNYLFRNIHHNLDRMDRKLWHSESILDIRDFPDLYWSMETTRNSLLEEIKKVLVGNGLAEKVNSVEAVACVLPAFLCNGLVIPSTDEKVRIHVAEQKMKELREKEQVMEKVLERARHEAEDGGDNEERERAYEKYNDCKLQLCIAEIRYNLLTAEVEKNQGEIEKQKAALQDIYRKVDGITTEKMEAAEEEANPTVPRSHIFGRELRRKVGERGNNTYFHDQESFEE